MEKRQYETALLLTAGVLLGEVIAILLALSFSVWSFIPILLVILLLGIISLWKIAHNKSLVKSSARIRLTTGIWVFLVWELMRRRFFWPFDLLKVVLLFVVVYVFYRIVRRAWEE